MGVSGCLKSIERVWEPRRIQTHLPASAATPPKSNLCKAKEMVHWPCYCHRGPQAPPAEGTLDSQHLTKC